MGTFTEEFAKRIWPPDAWDYAGFGAGNLDEFFKGMGELQKLAVEGKLTSAEQCLKLAKGYEIAARAIGKANADIATTTLSEADKQLMQQLQQKQRELLLASENLTAAAAANSPGAVRQAVAKWAPVAGKAGTKTAARRKIEFPRRTGGSNLNRRIRWVIPAILKVDSRPSLQLEGICRCTSCWISFEFLVIAVRLTEDRNAALIGDPQFGLFEMMQRLAET